MSPATATPTRKGVNHGLVVVFGSMASCRTWFNARHRVALLSGKGVDMKVDHLSCTGNDATYKGKGKVNDRFN